MGISGAIPHQSGAVGEVQPQVQTIRRCIVRRSFKNNNKVDLYTFYYHAQLLLNNVNGKIVLHEKNLLMVKF